MIRKGNSAAGTVNDPGQARRWHLQRKAQGLLNDKVSRISPYGDSVAHFQYRVAMCHRGTDGAPPQGYRSPNGEHARYSGLQTCGSVWHCPLCAPKVAAARRDEMNLAIATWLKQEMDVYFLTYTMQHDAEKFGQGQLQAEVAELAKALSAFKGSRAYRDILSGVDSKGVIRALEVTYGEYNGWHCHTHELMFAGPGNLRALRRLRSLWARQLIKRGLAGLKPGDIGLDKFKKLRYLLRRCFTVQPGAYAAEYVAKFGREPENDRGAWGIGSEMTRAHMKQGRGAGRDVPQRCEHASPWGLLNDALDGDTRSGELFREFAVAFQGKRQLYWSRGLKQFFFGVADRSDEQIAADADSRCTVYVCDIGPVLWSLVLSHNKRFDLLRLIAAGDLAGIKLLHAELERAPPSHSGAYDEGKSVFLRRAA